MRSTLLAFREGHNRRRKRVRRRVISGIHFFDELRPFLFTSFMSYWRGLFREDIEWGLFASDAAKLAGFAFLFIALAFHRFRVREEA